MKLIRTNGWMLSICAAPPNWQNIFLLPLVICGVNQIPPFTDANVTAVEAAADAVGNDHDTKREYPVDKIDGVRRDRVSFFYFFKFIFLFFPPTFFALLLVFFPIPHIFSVSISSVLGRIPGAYMGVC